MTTRVHGTAFVEEGVILGEGTSVWDHVHIRHGSILGDECIVGGKTYIAYDVKIGSRCKINSNVYICNGVTIEDGVMIAAGTIFTNDRFPRAATSDLTALRPSEPDESTGQTSVRCGATIGAGCIVGSNLTIGKWAMVGMGAIVTSDIPDFHLALGSPAKSIGAVCRCGAPFVRFSESIESEQMHVCGVCQRRYHRSGQAIRELE